MNLKFLCGVVLMLTPMFGACATWGETSEKITENSPFGELSYTVTTKQNGNTSSMTIRCDSSFSKECQVVTRKNNATPEETKVLKLGAEVSYSELSPDFLFCVQPSKLFNCTPKPAH